MRAWPQTFCLPTLTGDCVLATVHLLSIMQASAKFIVPLPNKLACTTHTKLCRRSAKRCIALQPALASQPNSVHDAPAVALQPSSRNTAPFWPESLYVQIKNKARLAITSQEGIIHAESTGCC